jgi:hypothetical protein
MHHAALYSNAIAHIAAGLHTVYQCISNCAAVPAEWRSALLVPIYKGKGDLSDMASYRPLSMPTVACRVWSSLINRKLMQATEDILPDVMFGFRPGRSCSDPLFIIRHVADMRKAKLGDKFAVAFMDLSGAYDSINRELLFEKLAKKVGLADHTLGTLRDLYTGTSCIVKCEQGHSQPFMVKCGLRQGCPLSTTLFNLFICDLHQRLTQHCPEMGVPVRRASGRNGDGMLLLDLGYADDIALCGSTASQLQAIIDCFGNYCTEHGLIINPSKCEAMVFCGNCTAWPGATWHTSANQAGAVQQRPLARVQKFKYLGVELHGSKSIKAAVDHRLSRMVAAQSSINRRLREMHVSRDPQLVGDLFETITAAAGSYGCEIWSTPFLDDWHLHTCKLQHYQATVYKYSLGLSRNTSNLLAFFETGRYPMQVQWLARTVGYWNKLVAGKHNQCLLTEVLHANVHYGLTQRLKCWSNELCRGLEHVMPDVEWRAHMLQLLPIDPRAVVSAAKQAFCNSIKHFHVSPTDDECEYRQRSSYAHYMHLGGLLSEHSVLPTPAYISADAPLVKKRAIAKIRMCCLALRANTDHSISYSQRICTRCTGGQVDNEHHLLFECPSMERVRHKYDTLLRECPTLPDLMGAVYDSDTVDCVMNFCCEIVQRLEGHRQGAISA